MASHESAVDTSGSGRWSRRAVLGTGIAVGGLGVLADPAAARGPVAVPDADLLPPGRAFRGDTGPVIDPAFEMSPPDARALHDVPRLSDADARLLASTTESTPGDAPLLSSSGVPGVPFTFRYHPFDLRLLPDRIRPYSLSTPLPLVDTGVHDASGVRMYLRDGRMWDHPVAQAQYGINLLESHRLTGTAEYLARAGRNAQRLIDRRVAYGTAWFYPYPFRFVLHGNQEVYDPPWYSMMAQGQALSLFCRLYHVTGEQRWRVAATATFASFLVPPVLGRPWGSFVRDGLLWLEEYAHPKRLSGDVTYNGHNFALFGLWDYWVLTRDKRARVLLQGALTTMRDVHGEIRNPNWRSKYCLRHRSDSLGYHTVHMSQHIQCYAITGDTVFAKIAELYYSDYPPHGVSGTVVFQAGSHVGYRFDAAGNVLGTKTITLSRRSSAPSAERVKIRGRDGIWFLISAGSLSGYHVKEIRGHSYQLGEAAAMGYRIPRPATVAVAPLTAYTIDSAGSMTSVVTNLEVGDQVNLDRWAVLNGVLHARLADGAYAGRWVGYTTVNRT